MRSALLQVLVDTSGSMLGAPLMSCCHFLHEFKSFLHQHETQDLHFQIQLGEFDRDLRVKDYPIPLSSFQAPPSFSTQTAPSHLGSALLTWHQEFAKESPQACFVLTDGRVTDIFALESFIQHRSQSKMPPLIVLLTGGISGNELLHLAADRVIPIESCGAKTLAVILFSGQSEATESPAKHVSPPKSNIPPPPPEIQIVF